MKVVEVIKLLTELKEVHGDVEVIDDFHVPILNFEFNEELKSIELIADFPPLDLTNTVHWK